MSSKRLKNIKILNEAGLSLKTLLNLSESNLNRLSKKAQLLKEGKVLVLARKKNTPSNQRYLFDKNTGKVWKVSSAEQYRDLAKKYNIDTSSVSVADAKIDAGLKATNNADASKYQPDSSQKSSSRVTYKTINYTLDDIKTGKVSAKIGDKDKVVIPAIQQLVGAKPDGFFGPKTLAKVKSYQQSKGLDQSGLVDKSTLLAEHSIKESTLSDLHRQKAEALENLENITADIETAKSQETTNEEEEIDVDNMGNPEWEQKDNGKVKQGLLDGEEIEMDEIIMYGGAPRPETSFYNPDAAGFQSQGPMDSYGQFDSEGFAGEQNEAALPDDETKYDYFKRYQHKLNSDLGELEEDTEQIDVGDASKGEYTQTPTQQQAPDGMGDGGDPGSRGMGILERLMREEAVSKSQKRFWCFVKSCKESKYKDCGEGDDIKNAAKNTSNKEIDLYCDTDDSKLPEKVAEAFDREIGALIESYENKSFTKSELIETIREASYEYEGTTMPMPTTTPTTTPTPTKTPTRKRPGRKTPYQPKHKPKPKAKAKDTEENMPNWLNFDSIFIDEKE